MQPPRRCGRPFTKAALDDMCHSVSSYPPASVDVSPASPFTSLIVHRSTVTLWQVMAILEPLTIDVANGFRICVVLILPEFRLPVCIGPHEPMRYLVFPSPKVVGHPGHTSAQRAARGPWGILLRTHRLGFAEAKAIQMRMVGPPPSTWSILHVVVLAAIHRQKHVWAFVAEDVLQTAPFCTILSVFGPHKGFRCLHIPEYSTVLYPLASNGAPFSCTVTMRTEGLFEKRWKVRRVCHGGLLVRWTRRKVNNDERKTCLRGLIRLGVWQSCFERSRPKLDSNSEQSSGRMFAVGSKQMVNNPICINFAHAHDCSTWKLELVPQYQQT
jgi:hypothetical protein